MYNSSYEGTERNMSYSHKTYMSNKSTNTAGAHSSHEVRFKLE